MTQRRKGRVVDRIIHLTPKRYVRTRFSGTQQPCVNFGRTVVVLATKEGIFGVGGLDGGQVGVLLNVLRCRLTYQGRAETNAEAGFNKSLRPRKPEGSLGRTAQDGHLDSHTASELL